MQKHCVASSKSVVLVELRVSPDSGRPLDVEHPFKETKDTQPGQPMGRVSLAARPWHHEAPPVKMARGVAHQFIGGLSKGNEHFCSPGVDVLPLEHANQVQDHGQRRNHPKENHNEEQKVQHGNVLQGLTQRIFDGQQLAMFDKDTMLYYIILNYLCQSVKKPLFPLLFMHGIISKKYIN